MNVINADNLFLDTSGLLCAHDENDFRNKTAVEYFRSAHRIVTTNYVLTEFVPLSQKRGHDRAEFLSYLNDLLLIPRLQLVWIDEAQHAAAMQLLQNRLDKKFSLCDAVSFIVVSENQMLYALTTDHHFEQEGFVKLLES